MQKQTRSIALPVPTVSPAIWMTLLLFLLATAMMGCEAVEDVEEIEIEEPEELEEDEDNGENDEDEDSASLRDSDLALHRA